MAGLVVASRGRWFAASVPGFVIVVAPVVRAELEEQPFEDLGLDFDVELMDSPHRPAVDTAVIVAFVSHSSFAAVVVDSKPVDCTET